MTTRKEKNDKIPFAHGMGLISDELYEVITIFFICLIIAHYKKIMNRN